VPVDLRSPRRLAAQRVRTTITAVRARCGAWLPIAALAALIVGLTGAAIGQWAGWRTAGPLPADGEAAAIARLALGGPVPAPSRHEPLFGTDESLAYEPGYVRFTVPGEPESPAFEAQEKDVRVRLATAGWRVDKADPPGLVFVADKGDWRVRYSTAGPDRLNLDIVRRQPMWVVPSATLGGLAGGLLGWFAAWFAVRRWRRLAAWPRRLALACAGAGAVALLPALAILAAQQIAGYAEVSRPQIPLWTAVVNPVVQVLAMLGGLAALAALGVCTFARANADARLRSHGPGPDAAGPG
jgi:hypothetical protein